MTKRLLACDFCQGVSAALFGYAMGHVVVYSGEERGWKTAVTSHHYLFRMPNHAEKQTQQNEIISQQICVIKLTYSILVGPLISRQNLIERRIVLE
jgi:hypothetical protein